jgi:hypothetical protein
MAQATTAASASDLVQRRLQICPRNLWTTLWKTRQDPMQTRMKPAIGFDCFIFQQEIVIPNQGLARF